jgi:iron complex outermembrane receptor protein
MKRRQTRFCCGLLVLLATHLGAQELPQNVLKPVEIRANLESDTRRLSTAAKIVVGREEIERYGDSSMGELLKRLPGVVSSGRPGRGGPPAMRGLGSGYTQIMIDGERAPRGFSLEDISPEQVERIEIMRAPTAETGARAIAGTINIITRGGFVKYLNNLSGGASLENGKVTPGASWSRSDTVDGMSYSLTLSAARMERANDESKTTVTESLARPQAPTVLQTMQELVRAQSQRDMLHANGRLQWGGAGSDSLVLTPMLIMSHNQGQSSSTLSQSGGVLPYALSDTASDNRFAMLRLGTSWSRRLNDGARLLLNYNLGRSTWNNSANTLQSGGANGRLPLSQDSVQTDSTWNSSAKYSLLIAEKHNLVSGLELEMNQREQSASSLRDGQSPLGELDGDLSASSRRLAWYTQDEWDINPHWAAHAGLRWESINTSGSAAQGQGTVSNQSAVLTPLLHAVWRPELASKDQIRVSLTRSYRSPDLGRLIARPTINRFFPDRGANSALHPDSAGNPDLQPELAMGIDTAYEHYLPGGGLLSANVFVRQIDNLMRSQTALETVSWADVPRWVSRMQNVGSAITSGLELEAKFRLREIYLEAPAVDLRANMSLLQSRLTSLSGPNNRLEQQADGTLNLGADYRLSGLPLRLSGNINWTPGYTTRLADDREIWQGDKWVLDASALWVLSPGAQLRLSASNLLARDYLSGGSLRSTQTNGLPSLDTSQNTAPSYLNLQARLELKL